MLRESIGGPRIVKHEGLFSLRAGKDAFSPRRLEWRLSNNLVIFLLFYGARLYLNPPKFCVSHKAELCLSVNRTFP